MPSPALPANPHWKAIKRGERCFPFQAARRKDAAIFCMPLAAFHTQRQTIRARERARGRTGESVTKKMEAKAAKQRRVCARDLLEDLQSLARASPARLEPQRRASQTWPSGRRLHAAGTLRCSRGERASALDAMLVTAHGLVPRRGAEGVAECGAGASAADKPSGVKC